MKAEQIIKQAGGIYRGCSHFAKKKTNLHFWDDTEHGSTMCSWEGDILAGGVDYVRDRIINKREEMGV